MDKNSFYRIVKITGAFYLVGWLSAFTWVTRGDFSLVFNYMIWGWTNGGELTLLVNLIGIASGVLGFLVAWAEYFWKRKK